MTWWQNLDDKMRITIVAGAAVALLAGGIAVGALVFGGADEPEEELAAETTGTDETALDASDDETTTVTEEDDDSEAGSDTSALPTEPSEKEATPTEPETVEEERVFGALRGIRDESGGAWQELWIDIDTADFLTGSEALEYLTSQGDEDFYSPDYWYVRDEGVAITSYRLPPSGGDVVVTMYTFPYMPDIGFYGPDMDPQEITFGYLYDAIYMNEDSNSLLGRYFWFTVEEGTVVEIEEQPRDPYYEP